MKTIDIKKKNDKERLVYATNWTKLYGGRVLVDIFDGHKFSLKSDSKLFTQWLQVTLNMYAMRGQTWVSKYSLLI